MPWISCLFSTKMTIGKVPLKFKQTYPKSSKKVATDMHMKSTVYSCTQYTALADFIPLVKGQAFFYTHLTLIMFQEFLEN